MSPSDEVSSLSRRGRQLVDSPPLPEYLQEHFARRESSYDAIERPAGYVPLCIAENRLVLDLVLPKFVASNHVPEVAFGYDAMVGTLAFREALARFMGARFLGREFAADQIAVLAGAGSVLEILFHALTDPGDAVLVPTPSYPGFWPDLTTRDELHIIPVHTASADGFRLRTEALDAAIASADRRVRALLFTSPDNPTGRVYTADELEAVLRWSERTGVHLVMDEIYALSVFGERPFVSAATLRPTLGERVHIVWAFSKDFAMSGARVGVLVSENRDVLQAVDALAYWSCASGPTQHTLTQIISDKAWVDQYLRASQERLATSYRTVTEALHAASIPYIPSGAGFFFLLDLRQYLPEPSWAAEYRLWRHLLTAANVNVTPGASCRIAEPGFMRLCFAGVSVETAVHAVSAIAGALRSK